MFNKIKEINNLRKQLKNIDFENFNSEASKKLMKEFGLDSEFLEKHVNELYSFKQTLSFTKINPDAITPKYNYLTDSGFDLHSVEDVTIEPLGRALIKTGLKFNIPKSCELQIRPKSGLALKEGLTVLNTPGTVDEGYTGEVMVIVFNTNNEKYFVKRGMKIAQGVLCPVYGGNITKLHEVIEVTAKDRGDKGFGSTGI